MRVRYDDAGVDREGFASHDPFRHAAPHHGLEQLAQEIALAEATVSDLGESRMVVDVAVEPQPTESAIGQIKMDLLAQPSLRANAEAEPAISIRIISSGSIEGRPTSL